jgi:K+-sensing histidine kinase KdpD
VTTRRATGGLRRPGRGRAAVTAGLLAPLAVAAVLLPFRDDLANTSVALVLVIVAVAATGHRVAGLLAALSAAVWFNFFWTSSGPSRTRLW